MSRRSSTCVTNARLLVVLLAVTALRAQEQTIEHIVDERPICSVHVVAYDGAATAHGLTFVRVEAENHDDRPHLLRVEVATNQWVSADVQLRRVVSLGPKEHARFFLPLPTPDNAQRLEVVIDDASYVSSLGTSHGAGLAGLLVADRSEAAPDGLVVLQALPSTFAEAVHQTHCLGADLPADWRLFTGFHAVVVDGRTRLQGDVQEALRRFVFAGGTLVVAAADRLPAGPLRDLCAAAVGDEPVLHGLGACAVIAAFGGDTSSMRTRVLSLPRAGCGTWPASDTMVAEQPVPGLGKAPVLAFLLVMLVFALLVGPVNFLMLRRLRRPLLALVTVPALGLGTTVVMLGYGLFHDGFGARGVVRSWTLLDQDRHECVAIGARTLFAGLSPGSLSMGPDVLLLAPRAFQRAERRSADRWRLDVDTGILDGGVLPSRTTTPLLSAQQGVARQRLRARFVGEQELHLLVDGGVQPQGEVVLRDPDGAYWVGTSPVLRRVAADEADAALQRLRRAAGTLELTERDGGQRIVSIDGLVARGMGANGLRPGSYATRVGKAPWLDEHGLRVDYDAQQHFVFGRLAAQDFVR